MHSKFGFVMDFREAQLIPWRDSELKISYLSRQEHPECLVLLHGLQSSSELFRPFFTDPRFQKYSLIAPDLVGFGQSDKPAKFTYNLEDQAEMVTALVSKLALRNVILIGHSLGGMISTLLMETLPEIEKVVSLEGNLVEADCGESLHVSRKSFSEFSAQYKRSDSPDYAFYKSCCSIVDWSRSGKLLDIFESSHAPRLLITGGQSRFVSRPQGNGIVLKEIPGAGHFLLTDRPVAVMDSISDFLGTS